MTYLLEAGPFSAIDGEGRLLFEAAELRLRPGLATVLDGTSGSGKSTLLRLVSGLVPGGTGVRRNLADREYLDAMLPAWRARVTLMAQDAPTVPGTVIDNLMLPYGFRSADGKTFDRRRARELLEAVGLESLPDDREVVSLSGGERHRLALVRGLLWDPPVLLADEPLAGLDEVTAATCFELMLDFAHRPDRGLIVVLHHGELAHRADTIVRLNGGRLEQM